MQAGHPISLLIYVTFAAVLVIGIVLLIRLFSRHSVHPMKDQPERNIAKVLDEAHERE